MNTLTASRPAPKGAGKRTEIVVLYADLRNFSDWSLSVNPHQAALVVQDQYERVLELALGAPHSFHKLLGDGFLFVWETHDHGGLENALARALSSAFEIHRKYWYASKEMEYSAPKGLGIGIACGEAVKVRLRNAGRDPLPKDFVGYPMNCGARLQKLAGSYGVALDARGVEAAARSPEAVLKSGDPDKEMAFLDPTPAALDKAARFKGLKRRDRVGFQYVACPALQRKLWQTDGRIGLERR